VQEQSEGGTAVSLPNRKLLLKKMRPSERKVVTKKLGIVVDAAIRNLRS